MAILPVINPFETPYIANGNIISNPLEAAVHMSIIEVDNGLENHISKYLKESDNFSSWRNQMPKKTPKSLSDYQKIYPHCDFNSIETEINNIGAKLSPGQFLFHGGVWPGVNSFTTNRPLSTSFCPQIALREAEFREKAYGAGQVDLFVLCVGQSRSNVFVYRQSGTNFGHEKEVLFSSGSILRLINTFLVRNNYPVGRINNNYIREKKKSLYMCGLLKYFNKLL